LLLLLLLLLLFVSKGATWKSTNYLRVLHQVRHILPNFKQILMIFRTGREMEEWYYALSRAATLTSNVQILRITVQIHYTEKIQTFDLLDV
jgi:type II secretory pathway component PulF